MSDNLATVGAIYEAFGKGDIPTVLSHLSEQVQWESWSDNVAQKMGVPWLQPQQGREGALEFFKIIGSWTFKDFQVLSLMAGGNQVAAEIVIEVDIPARDSHLRDEELHLWNFDDQGKVVRFRHYVDTAKHLQAAKI